MSVYKEYAKTKYFWTHGTTSNKFNFVLSTFYKILILHYSKKFIDLQFCDYRY